MRDFFFFFFKTRGQEFQDWPPSAPSDRPLWSWRLNSRPQCWKWPGDNPQQRLSLFFCRNYQSDHSHSRGVGPTPWHRLGGSSRRTWKTVNTVLIRVLGSFKCGWIFHGLLLISSEYSFTHLHVSMLQLCMRAPWWRDLEKSENCPCVQNCGEKSANARPVNLTSLHFHILHSFWFFFSFLFLQVGCIVLLREFLIFFN